MQSIRIIRAGSERVKKINSYIQSGGRGELNLNPGDGRFFLMRFNDRLNMWINLFSKVENADLDNYKKYTEEWFNFFECRQTLKYIYDGMNWSVIEGSLYDNDKKFFHPYTASINFYNILADVYYKLGIWNDFLLRMYNASFHTILRKSIFTQKTNGIDHKQILEFYGDKYQPYHLPVTMRLDRFFFCAVECMYYSLGGYSYLDNFQIDDNIDAETYVKSLSIISKAIDAGMEAVYINNNVVAFEAGSKIRIDSNNELHCPDGPAVQNIFGDRGYYYHGIPVSERIILHPESIHPKEIISAQNARLKEVMIEKFGLGRFIESTNHFVLDEVSNGKDVYQLIKVDIEEANPLVVMKVSCPSTKKAYYLRVPPNISNFKNALAWSFGVRADDFEFYSET